LSVFLHVEGIRAIESVLSFCRSLCEGRTLSSMTLPSGCDARLSRS